MKPHTRIGLIILLLSSQVAYSQSDVSDPDGLMNCFLGTSKVQQNFQWWKYDCPDCETREPLTKNKYRDEIIGWKIEHAGSLLGKEFPYEYAALHQLYPSVIPKKLKGKYIDQIETFEFRDSYKGNTYTFEIELRYINVEKRKNDFVLNEVRAIADTPYIKQGCPSHFAELESLQWPGVTKEMAGFMSDDRWKLVKNDIVDIQLGMKDTRTDKYPDRFVGKLLRGEVLRFVLSPYQPDQNRQSFSIVFSSDENYKVAKRTYQIERSGWNEKILAGKRYWYVDVAADADYWYFVKYSDEGWANKYERAIYKTSDAVTEAIPISSIERDDKPKYVSPYKSMSVIELLNELTLLSKKFDPMPEAIDANVKRALKVNARGQMNKASYEFAADEARKELLKSANGIRDLSLMVSIMEEVETKMSGCSELKAQSHSTKTLREKAGLVITRHDEMIDAASLSNYYMANPERLASEKDAYHLALLEMRKRISAATKNFDQALLDFLPYMSEVASILAECL